MPRRCNGFGGAAVEAIAVEQALHGRYLAEFGVAPAAIAAAEPSPDCLAYTSFLLATAHQQPWEVLVAAVLPCFWIYWDVACAITAKAAPQNPYRAWIDTYADPRFGEAVQRVIDIADARRGSSDAGAAGGYARRFRPLRPVRISVLGRRLPAARLAGNPAERRKR